MKKFIATFLLMSCLFIVSCDSVTTQMNTTTENSTSTTINSTLITTTEMTVETTTETSAITTVPTTEIVTTITTAEATTTTSTTTEPYIDEDPPFVIQMENESLKILQLTDLHLKYTSDDTASQTLNLITDLTNSDNFDLVVITGDMTLSPVGPAYFLDLIEVMESLETPWTFVFGNHEEDYNDYTEFLDVIPETEYLYFRVGPELFEGGYGNFTIQFQKNNIPFYDLIFMDSHAERENFTAAEGRYDYIKESQVEWYETRVSHSVVNNLVFMHIPLRQFLNTDGYVGTFGEYVCPQGRDTGLYDAFLEHGKTKGFFVGHDHLNDFYFRRDNILFAYGRATGYGGYGDIEKGGRVIEILANETLNISLLLESDVTS